MECLLVVRKSNTWLAKNLRAATQWLGVFINYAINENENTSTAAHRRQGRSRKFINALFFWEEDHCKASAINDVIGSLEFLRAHGYDVPTVSEFEGVTIVLRPLHEDRG